MQIGLRTIWEKCYEEAHAVIYVVDAACPERFDDARGALVGCPPALLGNAMLKSSGVLVGCWPAGGLLGDDRELSESRWLSERVRVCALGLRKVLRHEDLVGAPILIFANSA
ncbi:unnamed protein product [Closterium sp. Naga37s-1]|nr:unnamed protein product [Closterium sp. Naga37s-1]